MMIDDGGDGGVDFFLTQTSAIHHSLTSHHLSPICTNKPVNQPGLPE
jgi:hypothetical protein